MSVVSAPLKNDVAMQKDIFRLAAMLYTTTSDIYSSSETQLQMVKCIFIKSENAEMDYSAIISELLSVYKYHLSEDEIIAIIERHNEVFEKVERNSKIYFRLTPKEYERESIAQQKRNIDNYIDDYIECAKIADAELCKDAIHRYLYELTTTNINSYRVLLLGTHGEGFSDKELSVNVDDLSTQEREIVKNFLDWNNEEKNVALGNLVFCCLEYCLLVNGDSPNSLLKGVLRRREIYLDTNVVFRALGINGESRKKVMLAFLDKCKQAKVKLIVCAQTKKEFQDSIDHSIAEIAAYPRGDIYLGAYEQLTDYTIFAFFNEWHQAHKNLSLKYFKIYINSLYTDLIKKYNIVDGEVIPPEIYNSGQFKEFRNSYSSAIKSAKQQARQYYSDDYDGYSKVDSHDASIIRYIELRRKQHGDSRDIFMVSSDKALRFWDMTRDTNDYPIVIYPSQLFLILIKLCGRSESDFDSFVSFINIRSESQQISPEKANIIISGISSITEDIITQKNLVAAAFNDDFQNVIQHSNTDIELYKVVQEFSQNFLDTQIRERDSTINQMKQTESKKDAHIQELKNETKQKDMKLQSKQDEIALKERQLESMDQKLYHLAKKQIYPKYIFTYFIAPIALALLTIVAALFILFQFSFAAAKWNYTLIFFNWLKTTAFGKSVGDLMYIVDLALVGILGFLWKYFMRNPFNKKKREKYKKELIEEVLETNL